MRLAILSSCRGRSAISGRMLVVRGSLGLLHVLWSLVGGEVGVVAHGYGFAAWSGRHVSVVSSPPEKDGTERKRKRGVGSHCTHGAEA